ncbi:DUF3040 domain-containing protein [Streptacidiphilus rugosus]|uniref:DUF3040 domain-containing protein n=1 Tax=Streptacidiphilus rugosus TaxID=405783 RepID=UPI00056151C0|nr:DUF3040 domain-containing protein [Streptacidiphilus rugosus]
MLSQHDRRTLAAIEESLRADAPDLERLLTRFDQWAPERRRRRYRATWCAVLLGAVLLAVAFVVRSADLLVLSALLLMFGAVRWTVAAAVRAVAHRRPTRTGARR